MKKISFLLLTALLLGCSAKFPQVWKHGSEPEISDVVAELGGEEYVTGVKEIAPPEALQAYKQAIIANADGLLQEKSDEPILTVVKVDILGVESGDPTLVHATILAKVSESYKDWTYRYRGKRVALFRADYLFSPDNQFVSIRDSALIDVYSEI
jgi:hypothetical protein